MKKRMAILIILLAGWQITARPEVTITGILDGTLTGGCPKAIELFVTGTEDLNDYEIWRSLNGAPFGEGSGAISSLFGVYTNTFVYLVKTDHVNVFHDVFGDAGIYANVYPMGIISGNGNDGFQVRQKVGSVVIDQVWMEDATDSYRDSYWYRKHGTGPDGGWFPSNWVTPGLDALDGLDEAGLQAAVPFGTYANVWEGVTANWNDSVNWSTGIPPSFQTNVIIFDTVSVFPVISNLPDNPAVCMNLTLLDTARLTVGAGKALTVFGNLTLDTLGTDEPDRGLILKADSSSSPTGSLILNGEVAGSMKIECYLAKDNGWHFLSSPVDSQYLQPVFVPAPIDQSFDLYYWDEAALFSEGWINIRDESGQWNPVFENTFISGKGYLLAYSPANEGQPVRLFSGLPNRGNVNLSVSHTGNFRNLLGNPYTSAIDWSSEGIVKNNVAGSAMYIWDPVLNGNLGGYRSHNGTTGVPAGTTPFIPAMQGFFVQTLNTGSLDIDIFNDEPLVHNGQAFYKGRQELTQERIRLKIAEDQFSDETLIYFNTEASNGFDPAFDTEKFFNGHPNCPEIFTLADQDHQLCINILASYPVSVPIGLVFPHEDTLSLSAFDFEGLPDAIGIFLEDSQSDLLVNLRETEEYRFLNNPLQGVNRLTLHFMNVAYQYEPGSNIQLHYWYANGHVYIFNPQNLSGEFAIYSTEGRRLMSRALKQGDQSIAVSLPGGVYILKTLTPPGVSASKIFIY